VGLYSYFIRTVALPSLSLFTESRFWRMYRRFSDDPQANLFAPGPEATLDKVRALLDHSFRNVDFYRDRMLACGLRPENFHSLEDLEKLPPTTKADISSHFPDGITDASRLYAPWRYRSTSGTIERLTVVHDSRKRDAARAAEMFALHSACGYRPGLKYLEIPPDVCRNVCGAADVIEPAIHRYAFDNLRAGRLLEPEVVSDLRGLAERQLIYRRLTLPGFGHEGAIQPAHALAEYLRQIESYRPYLVKALPTYLYSLALHLLDNPAIRPPAIPGGLMPMGASLSPHTKEVVETAFQTRVHEDYGSAELGTMGAECQGARGIHPFAALFYVEILTSGHQAQPGELGKVLVTDLTNFAMPFIRYEIGDVALVRNGRCSCGLSATRIEVKGRLHDCLTAADGALVSSDQVMDALLTCSGVRMFQLETDQHGEISLQIVPAPASEPDIVQVETRLSELLGRRVRPLIRSVPTILAEAGGKFRFVRNLDPRVRETV
jgi:phenylacetate-CoA ligase